MRRDLVHSYAEFHDRIADRRCDLRLSDGFSGNGQVSSIRGEFDSRYLCILRIYLQISIGASDDIQMDGLGFALYHRYSRIGIGGDPAYLNGRVLVDGCLSGEGHGDLQIGGERCSWRYGRGEAAVVAAFDGCSVDQHIVGHVTDGKFQIFVGCPSRDGDLPGVVRVLGRIEEQITVDTETAGYVLVGVFGGHGYDPVHTSGEFPYGHLADEFPVD